MRGLRADLVTLLPLRYQNLPFFNQRELPSRSRLRTPNAQTASRADMPLEDDGVLAAL
jgi:hypothetical protein